MINSVALIGLGAMGVFFAPRLQATLGDEDFCVIAEGSRKERLQTRGVTLNGRNYKFTICEPKEGTPKDLIIMAVKYTGLEQAIQDIRQFVGENTQILCVMNGVESEARVAAEFGWEHILYSYMKISVVMKDGTADFDPDGGKVHFGEKENTVYSERVDQIRALFNRCRIPYEIDENMLEGLWFKYACNVGENLTCAMLGIPFGAYRVSEPANQLRIGAMQEVCRVAAARGIEIPKRRLEEQEKVIRNIPWKNKPSTLQDLEAGKKTEIEMFAGSMVRMGEELHVPTPISWVFLQGIHVLEEKNEGILEE
ncbi:MAG: ketopantoate reductase family protein [Eubacteriales bacterium]|nr:ketopantoate reductase family protein [Eubacteriales bacterium]